MRAGFIAAAICAVIVSVYLWFEPALPIGATYGTRYILAAVFVTLIALALFARNLLVSVTACLVTLVSLELVFLAVPGVFPDNVRMLVESGGTIAHEEIVESLPYSPFAKPRHNALVRIPGYYGPKGSFEYEWRADRRGFKNLPEIAAHDRFKIVAVGDSFTEGMGVKIEDTWTSRLSRKGHLTYNLGIQGYSPTQFLGAYEQFGRKLSPKLVIIGMLGNVHERERKYLGLSDGPQAIERLIDQDRDRQSTLYLETRDGYRYPLVVDRRHRFLTSALIAFTRHQINFALFFDVARGVAQPEFDARFAKGHRYQGEIATAQSQIDPTTLAASETWASALSKLDRIVTLAQADGAKVLLLFFPNRGTAYSSQLPANALDLVQARALGSFAKSLAISFIDFTPIFRAKAGQLPYLPVDGHPSPMGNEIIATEIARHLEGAPL